MIVVFLAEDEDLEDLEDLHEDNLVAAGVTPNKPFKKPMQKIIFRLAKTSKSSILKIRQLILKCINFQTSTSDTRIKSSAQITLKCIH